MEYREDTDLKFLEETSSTELNDLVECLTKDKDGNTLWTQNLTKTELFKENSPDHTKYWFLIAAEIQCFGANSLTTLLRGGKGVQYREILTDVCSKMDVKSEKEDETIEVENKLLTKILDDAVGKMSDSERSEFAKTLGITSLIKITPDVLTTAVQRAFKAGGFKSFQLTVIVANAVSRAALGRGIALAGNAAFMRTASLLTGPIGWTLTGAWTIIDIAGPAYRVTIPSVIQVAFLRKKYQAERDEILNDIKNGI